MAKSCECAGLLEMVTRDPRLRTLPAAARMLWLELVMAMRAAGVSVLRFGGHVPDANEMAMLAAMPASDVAANLEAIVGRGLLVRERDGALSSPLLVASANRSEINRANALAGVAKRRARLEPETQTRLPLVQAVAGRDVEGAANAGETGANVEGSPDAAIAKLESSKLKPKLAVSDAVYHETGRAVLALMGIDDAKSFVHYGIVRQWLADGATPEMILEVVGRKMAGRAGSIANPGYFTQAIREAVKRQPVDVAALPESSRRWTDAVGEWMANGCMGERPLVEFYRPGGKFAVAS